ncbi:MAG: phosphoribosylformylglycinamidine synthase subunit PurS [Verrucomicrobiae bacterium]|nr:phosphoribosylformylglycinamidine synthase subunit PurS [Verrucomicrobiae bacterium]
MKARVTVMPKKTVLDPQGKTVAKAIRHLGMERVTEARVGKVIELEIEGGETNEARRKLEEICRDLLSNPVIEDYRLEIEK